VHLFRNLVVDSPAPSILQLLVRCSSAAEQADTPDSRALLLRQRRLWATSEGSVGTVGGHCAGTWQTAARLVMWPHICQPHACRRSNTTRRS
jgi:hypothetical protein